MGSYVQNSLNQGEEIIGISNQHWIALVPRGLIAAFFILGGLTDISIFPIFAIIALIIMAGPLIRFATTELAYTNRRLIGKRGLIKTSTMDSPLNKINNVSVSNGLFGKIFGYGNILVTTSSGGYLYKGVARPENFKAALMNQVNQYDEDRIKKQATEMANAISAANLVK